MIGRVVSHYQILERLAEGGHGRCVQSPRPSSGPVGGLERKPAALGLVAAGGTAVASAYDLYLKGTGYLQQYYRVHYSPEPLAKAIKFFQSALKADPNFAMAYPALGDALWRSYLDPKRRDPALVEEARRKCRRAIELNEGLVPAHVGLGRILNGTGQREQAIEEHKKALQLDPMNSDTYWELANVYSAREEHTRRNRPTRKRLNSALIPGRLPVTLGTFASFQGRFFYENGLSLEFRLKPAPPEGGTPNRHFHPR